VRGPKVRLRGLSEIATNPPRLILAEQLGCRSPPRLVLEIDVGERLSVVVAHDKTGGTDHGGGKRRTVHRKPVHLWRALP